MDALQTVCMFGFVIFLQVSVLSFTGLLEFFKLWLSAELRSVLRESEDCSSFEQYPDPTGTSAALIKLVLLL